LRVLTQDGCDRKQRAGLTYGHRENFIPPRTQVLAVQLTVIKDKKRGIYILVPDQLMDQTSHQWMMPQHS
jgi:hypothetical protein